MWLPLRITSGLRRIRRFLLLLRNVFLMRIRSTRDRASGKSVVIVLSLDKLGPSREVARQALIKGYWVHIFAPSFPVQESAYAHDWTIIDPRVDFDRALIVAKKINPVAILLESKNLLLPMQNYLANELGLKSVGDKAVLTTNSKIELRRSLDRQNVPSVPWQPVGDDINKIKIPFPAVLKPDRGTASKGVRLVKSKSEIRSLDDIKIKRAYVDPSVGTGMLLEGFVEGRQFDLEGVAKDGDYILFCIVEQHYGSKPPYFPPSWFYFNPPISEEEKEVLWSTTQDALSSFGVKNGAFHLEQRLDNRGLSRTLDYANRMGYNHLVSAASGVSVAGAYVEIMTGNAEYIPKPQPRPLLQLFAFDDNMLRSMRRFLSEHPDHVQSHSFFSYEFSFHLYLGYMVCIFEDNRQLHDLLSEFGLLPYEFADFYDLDAQVLSSQ